ncbi:FdhF/YdeP family oxidoreductase [Sphingomonas sp. HT-1]|uniref:FdhF/YdeP family oxidoreductase n=1 Tax=unclassified Sphingomonas TaxID=196159 RepID=UPI00031DEB26|nr:MULTISPECIES: FdhF/YdeP family oxidoreductase [unclassified Sphingomonas]KTF69600.1 formate dehydrogenase [Sphingomonas sp. WG]
MARAKDGTIHYSGPEGGWGSLRGMALVAGAERPSPEALSTLARQNKPGGMMCTSCAWTKPAKPHMFEFCENGAKATLWDLTTRRATPEFFAHHTLSELRGWSDHDLEQAGRLTSPMRYDRATDKYLPCTWEEAFRAIGRKLRGIPAKQTIFYASGKASLEASYAWALFARLYGHNNLPDSSNMCHETTSVALKSTIGAPVGTCLLEDFEHCDAIFFFGQNTGTNSPRFIHTLTAARKRGAKIVTFNPIYEKGLLEFRNPQSTQMVTGGKTEISSHYYQLKAGSDIAAMIGMAKHVLAEEDRRGGVLDHAFIAEHTHGFEAFAEKARTTSWETIEAETGLARAQIIEAADVYIGAERAIGIWGMGLTQHHGGYDNVAGVVNLMLLRGNIGRLGAGVSPVRGHSNVQGQRTVGISEKPELVPLDRLAEQYGFDPPRDEGYTTVTGCEAIVAGKVRAFVGLGGNFLRAVPDHGVMEKAWTSMDLTVQIATKLNRGQLFCGETAYLLPCLVRSEQDIQNDTPQVVTMEDSLSCIHGSIGEAKPASPHLKSEMAIVAGLAQATLDPNPRVPWAEWAVDYAAVRDAIEATYPEMFRNFNQRLFTPGGFFKGNSARERNWKTKSGKADFTVPAALNATGFAAEEGLYRLITLRSNDQFNTTVYGYSDRLRGIEGKRDVVLINPDEMARAGLREGQRVALVGDASDGVDRVVEGLEVLPFNLPDSCLAGYYPELNPLIALRHHDQASHTPAAKSVPVRIRI